VTRKRGKRTEASGELLRGNNNALILEALVIPMLGILRPLGGETSTKEFILKHGGSGGDFGAIGASSKWEGACWLKFWTQRNT